MPKDVKELHLASSIEGLNKQACIEEFQTRKCTNKAKCLSMTKTLYENAMALNNDKVIDQERMYLYLFRAFEMWKLFTQSEEFVKDPKFFNMMHGKDIKLIVSLLEDLSNKLVERYNKLKPKSEYTIRPNHSTSSVKDTFDLKTSLILKKRKDASGEGKIGAVNGTESQGCILDVQSEHYDAKKFIYVHELQEKLNSNQSLLIIDIRPKTDFVDSHIKSVDCVNIPDNFINPGLSANKLGEQVEDAKQKKFWDHRGNYSQLVLMDWQSEDKDVIPSCSLDILFNILWKWDPHNVYKNKPLILSGGFLHFLDTFPTYTSNPQTQSPAKNVPDPREMVVDYPMSELDDISKPKPRTLIQPAEVHKPNQTLRPSIDRSSKPDTTLKKSKVSPVAEVSTEVNKQNENISSQPKNQFQEQNDGGNTEENAAPVSNKIPMSVAGEHTLPTTSPSLPATMPPRPQTPPRVHEYPTTPTTKHQKEKGDGDIKTERLKHDSTPRSSGLSLKRSSSSPNINKLIDDSSVSPMYDRSNKPHSPGYYSPRVSGMDTVLADPVNHPGRGLTGLKNFGNTCYMNSIMQCISNTVELNKELTRFNKSALVTRRQIASEVSSLLETLWAGDVRLTTCRLLKDRVGNLKQSFSTYEQQDAHEFLTLILDWLHEDLNQPSPVRSLDGAEESTGEKAWGEYRLKNNSVVLDLFYGQQKSTVTCKHCQKQSIRFEPFSNLSLPIPSEHPNGNIDLKECLRLYLKKEEISGWVCPNCKTPRDATQKLDITRLPPVLVLHLKRFSSAGSGSYNKRMSQIEFPLIDLDMKPFTHCDSELRHHNYSLYSVSNHIGSMEYGHYTAYCKNHYLNKWYKYNDAEVMEVSPSSVRSSAAYILFYESSSLQPTLY